jgi:drug/metabolite transporter (DMT)-like permease
MIMKSNQLKWFFLFLLALIWGSSFILIKKGLVGLSAYQLGSLRIVFTALFLIAIGFKTLPKIPRGQWKFIVITSLFGTFIPAFLFSIAQKEIDSSISAILNSLTPLNALLLGIVIFKLDYKRNQIFGVFIGLMGSLLLVFNGALHHPNQNYYYAILIFIASVCYAINVNLINKYLSNLSPLTITTGNFTVMLLPALVILLTSGFFSDIHIEKVQHSVLFILILGIVGTGIANIIFYKLIQISTPVFATSVTYLIPIIAFSWGMLDNETLTLVQLLGAVIILLGVYLSNIKS